MAIDPSEVRRIAQLAGLEIEEASLGALARDLGAILDYVAALEGADAALPEGQGSPPAPEPMLREDAVEPGPGSAGALANAADGALGHFRVPRVLRE